MASAAALVPALLARWDARAGLRAALEQAVRAQLAGKMPSDDVETLIEQQIATEQAMHLVEFFWLLEAIGCALAERMQTCIDHHNAQTTQMWVQLLLDQAIRTTKLLMRDGRLLQQQQEDLVTELLCCFRKAQRRIATIAASGEDSADYLKSIDTANRMLRELVACKRSKMCSSHEYEVLLAELEIHRPQSAPSGPRRRKRLERLLCDSYFGVQAKHACGARLDGTHVVLSSSDLERFMVLHMDPKLCRERLEALAKGGLLKDELISDNLFPTVRLFRATERLKATVTAVLERLHAKMNRDDHGLHAPADVVPAPGERAFIAGAAAPVTFTTVRHANG